MSEILKKLETCMKSVREKTDFQPKVALILGSGLGDFAETINIVETIDYHEIEGFPVSTVAGHKGRFVFGYIEEVPVVIMQGRVHSYEGYSMQDVVLPTRLMKLLGAEVLFLTHAAGGMNPDFVAGDLMMITDHISSFIPSPLIGENVDELGPRFPDMSEIYNKELRSIIRKKASELEISLKEGVCVQLTGPAYESPAEKKMYRAMGGDSVGMSVVCEAIAGNHMGMKICGISFISNLAAGMSDEPLNHKEVQEAADKIAPLFQKLVRETIIEIGEIL